MASRRDFLKTSTAALLGMGALASSPRLFGAAEPGSAKPPARFIFLRKSNGTFPSFLVPPSLSAVEMAKEEAKEALDLDLNKHVLPEWMAPLNAHKKNLTILQGLSAKMCTMGHSTYQSPLGVCRSAERVSTITRATVDVELARMFPTPFEHIELTCAGNQKGVVRGMSAIGPMQPNYAFASPSAAVENLFLIASEKKEAKIDQELDNSLYTFLSNSIKPKGEHLGLIEGGQKIGNYANSVDALIERNRKLQSMSERIRKCAPRLSNDVMMDNYTTLDQQRAFVDVLLASISAGLSNVITLTLDDLGTVYSGLYEFDIQLHEVGHGKDTKGVPALDVRKKLRTHHMTLVDKMVQGLKQLPEGNGSVFDNTVIMYFPENGETHHSIGSEVPFLIIAGDNAKVNASGRYIRLPAYNQEGHKTLGNFYTSLLNAYGNPIKHYGDLDTGLKMDQSGPIRHLMA